MEKSLMRQVHETCFLQTNGPHTYVVHLLVRGWSHAPDVWGPLTYEKRFHALGIYMRYPLVRIYSFLKMQHVINFNSYFAFVGKVQIILSFVKCQRFSYMFEFN